MSRDDIQKLLGGYATGTLTAEEQEILFAAALEDQELFDALAREQSLRDLLRDPSAKARLLTALDEKPAAGWASWWRPAAVGFAMTAVSVLTVVVVRQSTPTPKPAMLSVVKPQEEMNKAPVAVPTATTPMAQPELRQARDKDVAAPENEKIAKKRPMELDSVAPRREDAPASSSRVGGERVGVVGGVAGGAAGAAPAVPPAPVVQQAAAPPPPPSEPPAAPLKSAPPKAETAASADALFARSGRAADLARARPSARLLFLNQTQAVEMMKSFVEPAGQQGQVKEQAQAPSGPRQQQQTYARQNIQLQDAKSLVAPPPPGIRYSVASTSQVRLETNDDGYLYAMARGLAGVWRVVLSGPAQRMQPYLTTALRPDEKEIFVSFSPQIQAFKAGPSAPEPGAEPATNLVEKEGDTNYVVNPLPGAAGRQVSFTIRLP